MCLPTALIRLQWQSCRPCSTPWSGKPWMGKKTRRKPSFRKATPPPALPTLQPNAFHYFLAVIYCQNWGIQTKSPLSGFNSSAFLPWIGIPWMPCRSTHGVWQTCQGWQLLKPGFCCFNVTLLGSKICKKLVAGAFSSQVLHNTYIFEKYAMCCP